MRYSTTAIILAAMAVGEAVASPTHNHHHRHTHEKKSPDVDWDALDWSSILSTVTTIDWSSAWAAGQATKTAAAAVEAKTTLAVSEATTSVSSANIASATGATSNNAAADLGSLEAEVKALVDGIFAASNDRKTFGGKTAPVGNPGDDYIGNVGQPYSANVIKVSSTEVYPFTANFINTQDKTIAVNIWNKCGPDGRPLSGSALAPSNTTLTLILGPSESQMVAFDENSQVAFTEVCAAKAASGAYANTWGEINFSSGGSGFDVSAIMNESGRSNYDMNMTAVECTCQSTMTTNMWLTADEPVGNGDGSCFISQSTATLTVTLGGKIS